MGTGRYGLPTTRTLSDLLDYQHLVVTRQQALAFGLSDRTMYHRSQSGGRWQRLLPGVFLTVTGAPTVEQRDTAAVLYGGLGSTLSCGTALRRHGLHDPDPDRVHLLVPAGRQRLSVDYLVVHRTWRLPPLVCYQGPIQYALPARAVADAVREIGDLRGVRAVMANAVQSRACTTRQLAEELVAGSVRGSALFRTALAEVGQGPGSVPEIDLMLLIRRGKLPEPLFNPKLYVGAKFLAKPDAWWPKLGVAAEVDSKQWHLSPADWEQTSRRRATMTALGIMVLSFTPRQIRDEPEAVLSTIRVALNSRRGLPPLDIRTVPASPASD
jgi:very-short-patch-repair endonuclease